MNRFQAHLFIVFRWQHIAAGLPRATQSGSAIACTVEHSLENDFGQRQRGAAIRCLDRWLHTRQYWHVPADVDIIAGVRGGRQESSGTQMPIVIPDRIPIFNCKDKDTMIILYVNYLLCS